MSVIRDSVVNDGSGGRSTGVLYLSACLLSHVYVGILGPVMYTVTIELIRQYAENCTCIRAPWHVTAPYLGEIVLMRTSMAYQKTQACYH